MTTTQQSDMPDLSERLRALDDEMMCFDEAATYDLICEAADEIDRLRAEVEGLRALAYSYPPSEPFAPDGETWQQRATAAEAALAAIDPASADWREVAMSNGKALAERNAAELAAVTAERECNLALNKAIQEVLKGISDGLMGDCAALTIPAPVMCPRCEGSGVDPVPQGSDKACLKCSGEGMTAVDDPAPDDAERWVAPSTDAPAQGAGEGKP